MTMSYEKALPAEQWQQVLVNVPAGDLCNVVKTSRYMYSVASWPELWADTKVNMEKVKENGLTKLYSINRFKKITNMDFSNKGFTHEQLERVFTDIPGSPLKKITLAWINLSEVSAELLARAVPRLQCIRLGYTQLLTDQCIKVLEASLSSTTLVNVDFQKVNLSEVSAELLARAVSRLQTINLCWTDLTTDQCVKVLEASLSSTTLVNVDMRCNQLGQKVPAELLASIPAHWLV